MTPLAIILAGYLTVSMAVLHIIKPRERARLSRRQRRIIARYRAN